jgi:intracellular multiplication protein IcmB
MGKWMDSVLDTMDTFMAWLSSSLKQTTESYCDLETADSETTLVAHDGSLISVLKIHGVTALLGATEFDRLREALSLSLQTAMSRTGHAVQVYFSHDRENIRRSIGEILGPAQHTAQRLSLELRDLFNERIDYLSRYCSDENLYFVLWTRPKSLNREQFKQMRKEKLNVIKKNKLPPFLRSQSIIAAIPELRNSHDAFVRSLLSDLRTLNLSSDLLTAHDAVYAMRYSADPDFTDVAWRATLPGDKLPVREVNAFQGNVTDILWPSLARQILPRDAENIDLRTVRIGDKIYSSVFIDLFPKDIKMFMHLFNRVLSAHIPWRISYFMESKGLETLRLKGTLSSILSFSSASNRLISDAANLLDYISVNTDDAVVRLRVTLTTWAPVDNMPLLRVRAAELAKAVEGWGTCEVSEISGDPFAGVVSSMLGVSADSVATPAVAPLSDVVYMLPITRPASPWDQGAILFRTPDGKPWPFQPASSQQTTWIDIVYARPGSGKSVLSNALNLALCLSAGLLRLPRIAIVDIGPSSSGLISLLREALPANQRHLAAYHRLRMTPDYAINPFDTQLGCRFPTAQERSFLVNFLTLLATPIGAEKPYDAVPDLVGMVIDELYKQLADSGKPYTYTPGLEPVVDAILEEISFIRDAKTTWWEVTDSLFLAGFVREAALAQRFAMPLLADAASVCRSSTVEDLYGGITISTGETLINAFARMVSGAVREYPILSRVTAFDLGEARVVSLDLDEVAKSGGDAADRQTAVMYMLARHVLAKDFYLNDDNVTDMPEQYRDHHRVRINEIKEDPKRLVYDEFHRTAKSAAVRDQVIVDMREGRKWKVQVALLSQSLDDFDSVMVEFATSIYILDAGPAQSIDKTANVFGLTETGRIALRTRVHGPKEGGATFLALFATKLGVNTQLLTLTLGPIELWAFSTTAEDAALRNKLYKRIGAVEARRVLGNLFPNGTATKLIEARLAAMREEKILISDEQRLGIVDSLVSEIMAAYSKNPDVRSLVG